MRSQRTTGDSKAGHWPARESRPGSPSGSTSGLLVPFGNSHATRHPVSGLHFREGSGNARKAKTAIPTDVPDGSEERLLSPHSYPPSQCATYRDPRDHMPISAPTLFSRHAAPLSLPQLDKYISSLPLPAFSSHSRTNPDAKRVKFLPLDRLASTGTSIESLETNYKEKPSWRNRSLILGGLVNTVLGVTVGSLHSTTSFLC